jgi:large subunit ribosomal protein L30
MIAIIRISGMVEIPTGAQETMFRMRLRRKYTCVVLQETPENLGMIANIRDFVAFGKIKQEDFKELIEKRGQAINRKKKIEVFEFGKGKFEDHNLKPFFRLHPPRGGIDSKKHYPKGVLGSHGEKINELMRRML